MAAVPVGFRVDRVPGGGEDDRNSADVPADAVTTRSRTHVLARRPATMSLLQAIPSAVLAAVQRGGHDTKGEPLARPQREPVWDVAPELIN